jgi:biopolymer transport protein ExbB
MMKGCEDYMSVRAKGYGAWVHGAWRLAVCAVVTAMMFFSMQHGAWADESWWNEDWQVRKKITFDTTESGADVKGNLGDVPVLLRLHSGNMNFAGAKDDGTDIRFLAADDKTVLKHHLESYDSQEEIALIWVKVPKVSGASNQDYIWMYFGNNQAVSGEDQRGTFGGGSSVFHFSESQGLPADSSEKNIPVAVFTGSQGLPSVIGSGISLNGLTDRLSLSDNPQLDMKEGFTFSSWVKIPTALDNAVLFNRSGGAGNLIIGVDQTKLFCQVDMPGGKTSATEKTAALSPGTWHFVAVTGSVDGLVTVYVDGIKIDWMNISGKLPAFSGDMALGSTVKADRFFTGEMDEVRIATSAFSEDRIRMDFATQGADKPCVAAGPEITNEGGGLPMVYMSIVAKNITLDGWLIIGILMILGLMSWVILATKALSFKAMAKENLMFRETTRGADDRAVFKSVITDFDQSSLYRLYQTGTEAIKKWFDPENEEGRLSSKQIDYVKSELEKSLINETSRMNDWMTVLTMAISGGPFLGLLGTVWGVMSTFAAMADMGEANIMAIAPGVASALATTVVGLIVAIPALFGYSYLSIRIRQATIDLNIYVDEFSLLTDRVFGEER